MVAQSNSIQRLFLLLPLAFPQPTPAPTHTQPEWSYANTQSWSRLYPQCSGLRQSPIHLKSVNTFPLQLPAIRFHNYEIPLAKNLTLTNNGHTVELEVPRTVNGACAYITGATLQGRYEAVAVHFHWGSSGVLGSEHVIDNRQYDAEMHIVHRNSKYPTTAEATKHADGLSVIAVMFKIALKLDRFYPGLNKIFNQLPAVVQYRSTATINGDLTLRQLLGDLNTKNFFTYSGSLTTPSCAEAVTWLVFPEPLPIAYEQIRKFWSILSGHGGFLLNNVRPLQRLNDRAVYFRTTQLNSFLIRL